MLDGEWHVWRTGDDVLEWKFEGKKDGQPPPPIKHRKGKQSPGRWR